MEQKDRVVGWRVGANGRVGAGDHLNWLSHLALGSPGAHNERHQINNSYNHFTLKAATWETPNCS